MIGQILYEQCLMAKLYGGFQITSSFSHGVAFWRVVLRGIFWRAKSLLKTSILNANGESRPLVTDVPVRYEKWPVQIQDFEEITGASREVYEIFLESINANPKRHRPRNRFVLETLGSRLIMPKNLPDTTPIRGPGPGLAPNRSHTALLRFLVGECGWLCLLYIVAPRSPFGTSSLFSS